MAPTAYRWQFSDATILQLLLPRDVLLTDMSFYCLFYRVTVPLADRRTVLSRERSQAQGLHR